MDRRNNEFKKPIGNKLEFRICLTVFKEFPRFVVIELVCNIIIFLKIVIMMACTVSDGKPRTLGTGGDLQPD